MKRIICKSYEEVSLVGALVMAQQIYEKPNSVLGLATGSTPLGLYKALIQMHKRGDLDFSSVTTFNLDEYYPIPKSNDQSYDYFMWENFFSHLYIDRDNVHLPNGEADDPERECQRYDAAIQAAGGIDMQLLGIGVNGHVGFNEPDELLALHTHVTDLTQSTIEANARFFASADEVPCRALTMGMGNILSARKILILISGENKAPIVKQLFADVITPQVPASFLRLHHDVTYVLDEAAAQSL